MPSIRHESVAVTNPAATFHETPSVGYVIWVF